MEYSTPISNRVIDWLIYGNHEYKNTPLKQTGSNAERIARFNQMLHMTHSNCGNDCPVCVPKIK
jgi:hypothetical protein